MKKNKKNHDMSEEKKSVQDADNLNQTPADENLQNEQNVENEAVEQTESVSQEASDNAEIRLTEAEIKLADMQDKFLRQAAEFDNYRKRTVKELSLIHI